MTNEEIDIENYFSSPHSRVNKAKMKITKSSAITKPSYGIADEAKISEINRESLYSNSNACPFEISRFIVDELGSINKQLIKTKNKFMFKATNSSEELIEVLKQRYLERVARRTKESCSTTECIDDNLGVLQRSPLVRNEGLAEKLRKRFNEERPIIFPLERIPFYSGNNAPILIENQFKISKKKKDKFSKHYDSDKIHIFVLIHGIDASYLDMIHLMNEISLVNQNANFVLPECMRKENSHHKIQKLAKMVSDEILEQLNEKFEYEEIGKISFVCHSLGGIVARA
jgi:hypothetical protein